MTLEEELAPVDVQQPMVLDDDEERFDQRSESQALSRDFAPMNLDLGPHLSADPGPGSLPGPAADPGPGSLPPESLESLPEPASSSTVPRVKAEPASSSTTTRVKAEPVEPRVKVKAEPRTERSDQRSKGPHSPMPLSLGQRNKKLLEEMKKRSEAAKKAKAKAKAKGTAVTKKTLGSRVK